MSFKDLIKRDAAPLVFDDGETVLYKRGDGSCGPVEMTALINRVPLEKRNDNRSITYPIEVYIPRDQVKKIDIETPDTIKLKRHISDRDPVWMTVSAILGEDEGFWHLAVGR